MTQSRRPPPPTITLTRDELAQLLAAPVSRFHATPDPGRATAQATRIADEIFLIKAQALQEAS